MFSNEYMSDSDISHGGEVSDGTGKVSLMRSASDLASGEPSNLRSDVETGSQDAQSLSFEVKLLVFHAFLSFVICSMDRINISVAIIPMSTEFSWSHSRQGIIQSIFFVGYMITMIPGGKWADSRGGRRILALGVIVWSLATALIPLAAPFFPAILLARVLLGAGEGVAMPSMNALIAATVHESFRARSLAFIYSGMYVGSIIGLLGTPVLLRISGYPAVFYVSAAIGIFWATIFMLTTKDPPALQFQALSLNSDDSVSPETPIAFPEPVSPSTGKLQSFSEGLYHEAGYEGDIIGHPSVIEMLSHKPVWAIIVAQFCCTWGYFVLLAWIPTYLHLEHNLDVSSSALLSTLPWISMFTFANIGGVMADILLNHGLEVTYVRKLMQGIGFAGPCVSLLLLMVLNSLAWSVTLIAFALATSAFSQSGVYANHQDIGPRVAGTLLGISSTFASLPGLIGVWITGVILDVTDRNWNAAFSLAAFFYMFGFIFYSWFGTSRRIW